MPYYIQPYAIQNVLICKLYEHRHCPSKILGPRSILLKIESLLFIILSLFLILFYVKKRVQPNEINFLMLSIHAFSYIGIRKKIVERKRRW